MSAVRTVRVPHAVSGRRPGRHLGRLLGNLLVYALCLLVALLTLIPLAWMIFGSLKGPEEVVQYPPTFLPHVFVWHNYVEVFTRVPFARYIFNTFFVATTVTLVALLFHAMSAYALARLRFRGREVLFLGIVATLMIPFSITLIPTFLLVRSLGWLDSYWALIVPAIPNAFGIFLLRQFYLSLPDELEEAARLDGATPAQIFWYVALPMSRPILATLATFFFLANWNAYLWPLIVTQKPEMRVTQVALAAFSGEHSTEWQLIMAGATVAAIPGLLLYLFLQRYLIEGIKLSGLK
ncbi:carbohydrate ABC transporter permease [Deinococcus apachensis]|uniref:carbohydrate ABC transporter permease n=1 Tax=Deinococcus apachensis TaxID=309886 RepID=UPI000370DD8D|nr:carbohydrate ABC transporter permease [Deinococcus apachensis]